MAKVMPTVLQKIVAATKERVERERKNWRPLSDNARNRQPLDFTKAFSKDKLNVIAEVKLASPSAGSFGDLDPLAIAKDYLRNGAAALSVLTEPDYFHGSLGYLASIRPYADIPLLMKDFFLSQFQLDQALSAGADCILLIVSMLEYEELCKLHAAARERGLSVLVEVHDEEELHQALEIGARLVGVNNRNLHTLEVSLDVARHLAPIAREHDQNVTLICESGIYNNEEMVELKDLGYDGFLVGTSLVRSGEPGMKLRELMGNKR